MADCGLRDTGRGNLQGSSVYKFRPNSFFNEIDEGVVLRNDLGAFTIRGPSAYRIIAWLYRRLDGFLTVDEIIAGLQPSRRPAISEVLRALNGYGFLHEVALQREVLPAGTQELFGEHLAYISFFVDRPYATFLRFRNKRALCIGRGGALRAGFTALAESGSGHCDLLLLSDNADEWSAFEDLVGAARRRDSDSVFTLEAIDPNADALDKKCEDADYVVIADAETDMLSSNSPYARIIRKPEILAAIFSLGELTIAASIPAASVSCWKCLHMWLGPASEYSIGSLSLDKQNLSSPVATSIAAHVIAHDLFRQYTGLGGAPAAMISSIETNTLAIRPHAARRHPACTNHPERQGNNGAHIHEPSNRISLIRPELDHLVGSPRTAEAQDQIFAAITSCVDPVVGPLLAVDEGELSQLPLAGTSCAIRAQAIGSQREKNELTIVCRGISARETRNQVVLSALEALIPAHSTQMPEDEVAGWPSSAAIGVGWSLGEAMYRSLGHATCSWLAKQLLPDTGCALADWKNESQVWKYLIGVTSPMNEIAPRMSAILTPTGLFGAWCYGGGLVEVGSGCSADLAASNALLKFVASGLHLDFGHLVTTELAPEFEYWEDVLALAMAAQDSSTCRVSWLSLGQSLRFLPSGAYAVRVVNFE
jgi:hypothetical protein